MITRTIAGAALMLFMSCPFAQAHAMLDRASPAVGSTVTSAPRAVTLTFTQDVEPAFSSVRVEDSGGAPVTQGKAKLGGSRNMLRVGLKPLAPGSYRVIWKVLSVDTHTTQGNFSFQVGR